MIVVIEADKSGKEIHTSSERLEEVTAARTSKMHRDVLGKVAWEDSASRRTLCAKPWGLGVIIGLVHRKPRNPLWSCELAGERTRDQNTVGIICLLKMAKFYPGREYSYCL